MERDTGADGSTKRFIERTGLSTGWNAFFKDQFIFEGYGRDGFVVNFEEVPFILRVENSHYVIAEIRYDSTCECCGSTKNVFRGDRSGLCAPCNGELDLNYGNNFRLIPQNLEC